MNSNDHTNNVIIEVDSDLESIVPDFIDSRKNDCTLIHELLSRGAFDEIRTLGHRMKGAGGSYGFDQISYIGEIVENASLLGDHETIRVAVQQLADYLERVFVVYV